jgi:septum formation protein
MSIGQAMAGEAVLPEGRARGRTGLVLASRSPRRRLLLRQHGFEHEAVHPGIDDGALEPGAVSPREWVAASAYLKARAGAELLEGEEPRTVLGADTVCVQDGAVIGQPRDEADARRMLGVFENREHEVITGVALLDWRRGERRRHLLVDRARVRVGAIGRDRTEVYLASGEWRGKAGAYNLSERLEAGWPITFEGDPGTIMGLPMSALEPVLRRLEDEKERA